MYTANTSDLTLRGNPEIFGFPFLGRLGSTITGRLVLFLCHLLCSLFLIKSTAITELLLQLLFPSSLSRKQILSILNICFTGHYKTCNIEGVTKRKVCLSVLMSLCYKRTCECLIFMLCQFYKFSGSIILGHP